MRRFTYWLCFLLVYTRRVYFTLNIICALKSNYIPCPTHLPPMLITGCHWLPDLTYSWRLRLSHLTNSSYFLWSSLHTCLLYRALSLKNKLFSMTSLLLLRTRVCPTYIYIYAFAHTMNPLRATYTCVYSSHHNTRTTIVHLYDYLSTIALHVHILYLHRPWADYRTVLHNVVLFIWYIVDTFPYAGIHAISCFYTIVLMLLFYKSRHLLPLPDMRPFLSTTTIRFAPCMHCPSFLPLTFTRCLYLSLPLRLCHLISTIQSTMLSFTSSISAFIHVTYWHIVH